MAGPRFLMAVGVLCLGLGAAAGASPVAANDGSLYAFGVEALVAQGVPDDQCSVAQTGASFGVTCPPIGTSLDRDEMADRPTLAGRRLGDRGAVLQRGPLPQDGNVHR